MEVRVVYEETIVIRLFPWERQKVRLLMLEPHLEVGAYLLTRTSAAINQRLQPLPQILSRNNFITLPLSLPTRCLSRTLLYVHKSY
jgi:hypothetical protein